MTSTEKNGLLREVVPGFHPRSELRMLHGSDSAAEPELVKLRWIHCMGPRQVHLPRSTPGRAASSRLREARRCDSRSKGRDGEGLSRASIGKEVIVTRGAKTFLSASTNSATGLAAWRDSNPHSFRYSLHKCSLRGIHDEKGRRQGMVKRFSCSTTELPGFAARAGLEPATWIVNSDVVPPAFAD